MRWSFRGIRIRTAFFQAGAVIPTAFFSLAEKDDAPFKVGREGAVVPTAFFSLALALLFMRRSLTQGGGHAFQMMLLTSMVPLFR